MLEHDRKFTLCTTGLAVLAFAPLVSLPGSAILAITGCMIAVWFWPFDESKNSFRRIGFSTLMGCLAALLVLAPLASDAWMFLQSAVFVVKIIFWLLMLEALFYVSELWWQRRSSAT